MPFGNKSNIFRLEPLFEKAIAGGQQCCIKRETLKLSGYQTKLFTAAEWKRIQGLHKPNTGAEVPNAGLATEILKPANCGKQ